MGSDGIFDNLMEEDFHVCLTPALNRSTKDIKNVQDTANCLSTLAEIKSYDPNYDSPFAQEARLHKRNFRGGKEDDITVIVAQIKVNENNEHN